MRGPRASVPGFVLIAVLAARVGLAQSPPPPRPGPEAKRDDAKPPAPAPPSTQAMPAPKVEPKPTPKPLDQPRMLTAEETARRGRGSSLLLDPGAKADRYGEASWADAPPYRRASFFGVRTVAQTVVFVVDCSGSMGQGDRLERAKRELRRSVADMQFPQRFLVIFYNDEPIPMPGALRSAETASRDQLLNWLRTIDPEGGTDPRSALRMAIGMKPDAIYLLSDGAFPEGTAENVAARNDRKVPIHCIDLTGGAAGDHLRRIASDSGGQYAARP